MLRFQPKYRLCHPENSLFLLPKKYFLDQSIQKHSLFNFEKISSAKHRKDRLDFCVEIIKSDIHRVKVACNDLNTFWKQTHWKRKEVIFLWSEAARDTAGLQNLERDR